MTLDKELFLLIDESHFDKNWSLAGKIVYDQSKRIFMIFTGSSAINLEYSADAARRMLKYQISPLNYSQHLNLKYEYDTKSICNELSKLIFDGDSNQAKTSEQRINNDLLNITEYTSKEWDNYFKFGAM